MGIYDLSYTIYIYNGQSLLPVKNNGGQFSVEQGGTTYVVIYNTNVVLTSLTSCIPNVASGTTIFNLDVGIIGNDKGCAAACCKPNLLPDITNLNNCLCTQKGYVYNPIKQECIVEVCRDGIRTINE